MKTTRVKYCTMMVMAILCCIATHLFAQVGMTGNAPNKAAALDINATNKGVLVPNVSLDSTADLKTIVTPATGLLVYNTKATISGTGAKGTGFYFYDGSSWKKLILATDVVGDNLGNHIATQDLNMQANKVYFKDTISTKLAFLGGANAAGIAQGSSYSTVFQAGEKGTSPGDYTWTNYSGAATDVATERMRLKGGSGNFGIGTVSPAAMLHVTGSAQIDQQLTVKNLPAAGSGDKIATADDNGVVKGSGITVGSILQFFSYTIPQVASGNSGSVTVANTSFFMFTVTTSNSCGKKFSATYMVRGGVLFYLKMGSTSYTPVVNDPNGNALLMTTNIGTVCSPDASQVNYRIALSGRTITIQNNNTSTTQDYSIDMVQLG